MEIDIAWVPNSSATVANFRGAEVFVEDPDISSGSTPPLDGTLKLDGSAQASGAWAPVMVNKSVKSPAVVLVDKQAGDRDVRIYLAAYGPSWTPQLARANASNPTPSIVVTVPGEQTGESGEEHTWLITNPAVVVSTDYNRPDPNYNLAFSYTPPDPSIPIPANREPFSGCRIMFVPVGAGDTNPQFSKQTDSGLFVPLEWAAGWKTPTATPVPTGGTQFRCYFCSVDTLGGVNSLVEGVTPYALATVTGISPPPDVTNFTISGQKIVNLLNQTFVAEAVFAWALGTGSGSIRYAGVFLYLVNVTGNTPPLTTFPAKLSGQQSNVDTGFTVDISKVPANPEKWIVAAISVDVNGVLADDPAKYGQSGFHSPTVEWDIGPPVPGSPGSGTEYAPLVTLQAGAAATPTQSMSADGVGMVSFAVGSWTNPGPTQGPGQFGGAQVAMVINGDTTKPTYWDVPANATSFTTPAIPSFGNIGGAAVPVDFYIVSDDPQKHKNSINTNPAIPPTTPVISVAGGYAPTAGQIIPARTGWFDESQFSWDTTTGNVLKADGITADNIFVGKILRVGGGMGANSATFQGNQNGQIAVYNSSNVLRGWIGEQDPTPQSGSNTLYGAWFGQLWVGGSGPLTAPLFIDNQGIIEVGGIAAAQGATYPYISVRDNTGLEAGRIGAMISSSTDSTGNVGSAPPTITAGAWFTQLAVGGSNLTNWNVLITPDATNPLGSNFQMRNINLLSIDYPARSSNPAMNESKLEFGNSMWMAAGLNGSWQFAGIHVYEVGGTNPYTFGATFISRGVVLRGTSQQVDTNGHPYSVLASLVTWNGDQSGSQVPAQFFGALALYSPINPNRQNVIIASGSAQGPQGSLTIDGNAYMNFSDVNGNSIFSMDKTGCKAITFSTIGYGTVIDAAGNWKGVPITGSGQPQTPWAQDIAGNGHSLSGALNISCTGSMTAGSYLAGATTVINTNAQFVGSGVNMPGQGVGCNSWTLYYSGTQRVTAAVVQGTESISGASDYFVNLQPTQSGDKVGLMVNGTQCIGYTGIYIGQGVQCHSAIYGSSFGITGVAVGASGTFTSSDGHTITVNGGIITNIA